jgi:murein DD-endopeptidase MepM/ murein hydrolase activator NlpD
MGRVLPRGSRAAVGLLAVAATLPLALPSHAPARLALAPVAQSQVQAAADDLGVRDAAAEAAQSKLTDADKQLRDAEAGLNTAKGILAAARSQLKGLQAELARAQTEERVAQQQVDAANDKVNHAREQLAAMVRAALQDGFGGDIDVLMQAGTPDDLADRLGFLDQVSAIRKQRIDELASARDALAVVERRLADARDRALRTVAAKDAQVTLIARTTAQAEATTKRLGGLRAARAAAFKQAQTAAAQSRARYNQLVAASNATQALLAARGTGAVGPLPSSVASAGGLVMPVTGTFSSPFGYRVDPFYGGQRFHAGQDIAAPLGTPIVAATAGTVAYAGWASGYGNYTCIDRGGGFATCYGHQSKILVSNGQHVSQGQLIGLVGSTGASTGPHLHFEVRINGVPVDPVPYLP